jgi:RimJ/RimL family protein N-acetyltransferase
MILRYLTLKFNKKMLSVREMQIADIPSLVSYWFTADHDYLHNMGVDVSKMPAPEKLSQMFLEQLNTPIEKKTSYCIIWENNGEPIGHSNTNPTVYGREAKMHLHIWSPLKRKKGMGTQFVKMTLPHYFENFKLKTLWCEPYALNIAPNKTLEKAGFKFVKEYITVPGFINYEQTVKQWMMSYADYKVLNKTEP